MDEKKYKSVAILGLGYVGLPLALTADKKGYLVIGIDLNKNRVEMLNKRKAPFVDAMVQECLKNSKMSATYEFDKLKEVGIVIICVPTPVHENKVPDYGSVEEASMVIGKHLQRGQLIILESTINPGVCEEVVIPILEKESGLKVGIDFYLAHCPERINPGDPNWNVSNIARVVGGYDTTSCEMAHKFYSDIVGAQIKKMGSLKEAEAVKMVENSFRNINIAFVNELAESFALMGINVVNVINGAATKPFAFMAHYPSCGIGGHCIPVDPHYLIDYAKKKYGFNHKLLSTACEINDGMPKYTVGLVETNLKKMGMELKNAEVVVLGLAYKANVGDTRESPAFEIIKILKEKGVSVRTYDPHALEISNSQTLEAALDGVKAVIIATDHREFKALSGKDFSRYGIKLVVDGKNCLDKKVVEEEGIKYIGIGV